MLPSIRKVLASEVAIGYMVQPVLMGRSVLGFLTPLYHPDHSKSKFNMAAASMVHAIV